MDMDGKMAYTKSVMIHRSISGCYILGNRRKCGSNTQNVDNHISEWEGKERSQSKPYNKM